MVTRSSKNQGSSVWLAGGCRPNLVSDKDTVITTDAAVVAGRLSSDGMYIYIRYNTLNIVYGT